MRCGSSYQLAFLTPGIIPWSANFRKQIRHRPNFRYTARGRPHIWQRRRSLVENLGFCFAFAILDVLAIRVPGSYESSVAGVYVPGIDASGVLMLHYAVRQLRPSLSFFLPL